MKTMMMIAAAGIALSTGAANAQQVLSFNWMSNKAVLSPADPIATLTLTASWSGGVGYAASTFSALATNAGGHALTLVPGRNPFLVFAGSPSPVAMPDGSVLPIDTFQLPPAFNPLFAGSNPLNIFTMQFQATDFTPRTVTYTSAHATANIYTTPMGGSVPYTAQAGAASFQVVPAPGALALLGVSGLVAIRRRR